MDRDRDRERSDGGSSRSGSPTTTATGRYRADGPSADTASVATTSRLGGLAKLEGVLGREAAQCVVRVVKLHRSLTSQKNDTKRDPKFIALRETVRQLNLAKKAARQAIAGINRSEVRYGGVCIALKQSKKTRKPEELKAAVSQACSQEALEPTSIEKVLSAMDSEPVIRINVSDVKEKRHPPTPKGKGKGSSKKKSQSQAGTTSRGATTADE